MIEFSFNTLPLLQFSIASLLKCVSDFTTAFSSGKELFSQTYLLKTAPQRAEILISPVWNKIFKIWDILFELIQIEIQSSKSYFKEAGAFGNNIEKELQKPLPKLKKYVYYIFTENIWSACSPRQVAVFCKYVLIL